MWHYRILLGKWFEIVQYPELSRYGSHFEVYKEYFLVSNSPFM